MPQRRAPFGQAFGIHRASSISAWNYHDGVHQFLQSDVSGSDANTHGYQSTPEVEPVYVYLRCFDREKCYLGTQ